MPDYQQMYYRLFRANEKAIWLLIQAQQECEEMYLAAENNIISIKGTNHNKKDHP